MGRQPQMTRKDIDEYVDNVRKVLEGGEVANAPKWEIEIEQGTVFWDWRIYKLPRALNSSTPTYAYADGYGHTEAEAKERAEGKIKDIAADVEARKRLKPPYSYEV